MACITGAQLSVGDVLSVEYGGKVDMKVVKIEPYRGILNFLCGVAFLEGATGSGPSRLKIPVEADTLYEVKREEGYVEYGVADLKIGMWLKLSDGRCGKLAKMEVYKGLLDFLYGVATLKLYTDSGEFLSHYKLPLEKAGRYKVLTESPAA